MGNGRLIFGLIFFFWPLALLAQSPISFFEEHIDFKLDNSYFNINGIYSFSNSSKERITRQIIFPFACTINKIDSVKILDLNTLQMLPYKKMSNAVAFEISIPPKDTLDIHIFYRQKAGRKNTYILTSTQTWGKPLDYAYYTFCASKETVIDSFSYSPDAVKVVGNDKCYHWEKHDFLPTRNFEVFIK